MVGRTLVLPAGSSRHAALLHAAAASEPLAGADTVLLGDVTYWMSPASRSACGVIDTRSNRHVRNPEASSSRYPAGVWTIAHGRSAPERRHRTGAERVPLPHRRSLPKAEACGRQPTGRPRASQVHVPSALRCCFPTALNSQDPAFAQPRGMRAAISSRFSPPNISRVTPAGISPPGCVRRISKRHREAPRSSNDQKVTARTFKPKVCQS
jgi:hypothetical protein